jgi:peptidylprolyl isomerase
MTPLNRRVRDSRSKVFCFFFSKKKTYFSFVFWLFCVPALAGEWFPLQPANTLVVDTTKGRIVIEMRPDLAPIAVARVVQLSREHVYDGLLFHRVIDHFVDQTGNPNNHDGGVSNYPNLPPEFIATIDGKQIDALATQSSDGMSGFDGVQPIVAMPVMGHPGRWRAWGAYCTGVVGMGRQAAIDTGNSEIFFMRDAARRLDHDYTVWGRVVAGQDVVRAIAVGEPPAHPDRMVRVRLMADMPEAQRPQLEVIDTSSYTFRQTVKAIRSREGADFTLCDVPIATRVAE